MKNKSWLWNRIMSVCAMSCCALFLVACGDEASIKKEIKNNLKDPDSAKFGEFTIKGTGHKNPQGQELLMACVTVNAKNSMGGYTGNQEASLIKNGDKWEFSTFSEISHAQCLSISDRLNEDHSTQ